MIHEQTQKVIAHIPVSLLHKAQTATGYPFGKPH